MNALLVGMDWFPNEAGGLNRYFYDLVHELPCVGVRGQALVSYVAQGQRAPMRLCGMAGAGAPLRARWRGARTSVRAALAEGVELVNAHFALFAYPWRQDLPASVPLVVNFQGPWADEMQVELRTRASRPRVWLARHMERSVYRRAQRLITLSQAFAEVAVARYGVDPARIRVVPGALHTARFESTPDRQEARRRLGWPDARPIIVSVRRLVRRMGLDVLVQAMEAVRRVHPAALLLIAGAGPLEQDLRAQIARLDIEGNVRLLGYVSEEELRLAYAAADFTVVPTLALEGFGLITVESLAAGTPVLGTAIGGTREILAALDPALLFAAPDAAAFAQSIIAALERPHRLPDAAACRAHAAHYDWRNVAPRIRAVFDEAAAEAALGR